MNSDKISFLIPYGKVANIHLLITTCKLGLI